MTALVHSKSAAPASQQHGEFLGINAVCFRFSAVNGFQVQRVTEQKWQVVNGTQVSEPVPVKGGFAADDEVLTLERLECGKKICRFLRIEVPVDVLVAGMIHDTHVH